MRSGKKLATQPPDLRRRAFATHFASEYTLCSSPPMMSRLGSRSGLLKKNDGSGVMDMAIGR